MWKIKKPSITALSAFNVCITGITSDDLKERFDDIKDLIQEAELGFDNAAQRAELHLIDPTEGVGCVITKEMEALYDRHMARSRSRGRTIYDKLMIAAPYDICPFCGHRTVSTLDHTLPKSQHPGLAVTPINLIPCCKDCNHSKGNLQLSNEEDQLLNAYYDDVTDDRWLFAKIVEGSPPAAKFLVEEPDDWDQMLGARVRRHFESLELAKLYASQAGRQLQNIKGSLGEIFDAAGIEAVRSDLKRRYRSCLQINVNSWEGALFEAAADSDWYCSGGFRS